jgi:pimeloyl-ACP methyl ester carboxylesterase
MKLLSRRAVLVFLAAIFAGCAGLSPPDSHPPIVFVHGNGDTAALWYPTIWRFESNGWRREHLFAVDLPYPLARTDDSKPQEGRSSSAENRQNLAAEVEPRAQAHRHAPKSRWSATRAAAT